MGRRSPGVVRDAVLRCLKRHPEGTTVATIREEIRTELGEEVPPSSVRSYLRLNTPGLFERIGRGMYRVRRG